VTKPVAEFPAPAPAQVLSYGEQEFIDEWVDVWHNTPPEHRNKAILDACKALSPRGLWTPYIKTVRRLESYSPAEIEWHQARYIKPPPPNWDQEYPLRGQVPKLRDAWVQDEESMLEAEALPPPGMVSSLAQTRESAITYGPAEKEDEKPFKRKEPATVVAPAPPDRRGPAKEKLTRGLNNYFENMKWLLQKRKELRRLTGDVNSSGSYSDYSDIEGDLTYDQIKAVEADRQKRHSSRRRRW
jgi:hypothetical protein